MLRRLCCLGAICLALLPLAAAAEDYCNPMTIPGQYAPIAGASDDYGIGDPFVMRFNGMYYLYASSCEERVRVFASRNLVDWSFEGWCTEGRDVYFAYAPEVMYWRGDFYMITSPGGGGHYILKSDSPLGPFRPITHNFGYQIDGAFFVEDDGRPMILFPEGNAIRECFLNERTMLPDGIKYATGATLRGWTEGPGLFRRGDWYYLTFTGNHVCSTGYQVAWASLRGAAVGAFKQQADSTLLIHSVFGDDFRGLGHSSNFIGPDLESLYTAYHSCVSLAGPARLYNLDRLLTNGGRLYTTGPTNHPMPVPAMPDVWGDADGDLNDFARTDGGYFAQAPETARFTQECCFLLEGGRAVWLAGRAAGGDATLETDGRTLALRFGEETVLAAPVPELGEPGRLHTLRVECNEDVFYAGIDGMRLIELSDPGITAGCVGAIEGDGVRYAFMACTAQALGSGDNAAVKTVPGHFSAIHALNGDALACEEAGSLSERVPLLGRADYAVRVAEDGLYRFDLTVRRADAGRAYELLVDGERAISGVVPAFGGHDEWFTFTTPAADLSAGDHTLSIAGESVGLRFVEAFAWAETEAMENDFSSKAMRGRFITLGAFSMDAQEKRLSIRPNHRGFALFGSEGNTDYELRVRFEIPQDGAGTSGVLLRATNVSSYEQQVAESWFGYGVTVTRLGFNVQKMRYASVSAADFCGVPAWKEAAEGELVLRAQGNTLSVGLPDEPPLYVLEDAEPFTHGLYGFFSTGKALTVLSCEAAPLD